MELVYEIVILLVSTELIILTIHSQKKLQNCSVYMTNNKKFKMLNENCAWFRKLMVTCKLNTGPSIRQTLPEHMLLTTCYTGKLALLKAAVQTNSAVSCFL